MSDADERRKKRLQAVDAELAEAKADYKRKKEALKAKRKTIRKEWTPEDQREYLEKKGAKVIVSSCGEVLKKIME